MHDKDRRILERITNQRNTSGEDNDALETLKEFGTGFLEGLSWFFQNLLPGQNKPQLRDKRSRKRERLPKDFNPQKVLTAVPVKEDRKLLPDRQKQLTPDAGK